MEEDVAKVAPVSSKATPASAKPPPVPPSTLSSDRAAGKGSGEDSKRSGKDSKGNAKGKGAKGKSDNKGGKTLTKVKGGRSLCAKEPLFLENRKRRELGSISVRVDKKGWLPNSVLFMEAKRSKGIEKGGVPSICVIC